MKRISSEITFLYQVVFPLFLVFALLVMIKMTFMYPAFIVADIIYLIVCSWIIPLFLKLKDVWIDNDKLLISDVKGNQTTFNRKDIVDITQNPTTITPRLVKIGTKSATGTVEYFRFIPQGGHWIFWQHGIVNELNNWRLQNP
jgi:hypothetical protein